MCTQLTSNPHPIQQHCTLFFVITMRRQRAVLQSFSSGLVSFSVRCLLTVITEKKNAMLLGRVWVGYTFYLNPNFHFINGILVFLFACAIQNYLEEESVQGRFSLHHIILDCTQYTHRKRPKYP